MQLLVDNRSEMIYNQVLRPALKSNGKGTNIEKNEEKNTEKVTSSFTIFLLRHMALVCFTSVIFLSDCGIICFVFLCCKKTKIMAVQIIILACA